MAQFEGDERAKRVRNYFKTASPQPIKEYVRRRSGWSLQSFSPITPSWSS